MSGLKVIKIIKTCKLKQVSFYYKVLKGFIRSKKLCNDFIFVNTIIINILSKGNIITINTTQKIYVISYSPRCFIF